MRGKPPLVLLTRPRGRNARLEEALAARGCRVAGIPALAIEPLVAPGQVPRAVRDIDWFEVVICISPGAAAQILALLDDWWPQRPAGISWLATGAATAAELAAGGIDAASPSRDAGENAAGLLAMPELETVSGRRILVLRGAGGRPEPAATLRARGAQVTELDLYRRTLPAEGAQRLQELLSREVPALVVAYSESALENLRRMAGPLAQVLEIVPICVPGERLAGIARGLGFRYPLCAGGADLEAVLAAVDGWLRTAPGSTHDT